MADQQFCLRWNNHQSTLISVFDTLLENGTLVDCTLAAEGQYLKAHKVVLSACSPYLETLLSQHYEKHPIVILKDVKFSELKSMMDYMYRGEVNISQDQLGTFLKAAESLQIKGLSDNGADGDARDVGSTPKAPPPRKANQPAPSSRPEPSRPDSPLTDGSMSPSSRKRRRVRRSSQDDGDSHLDSNSCDLPSQAQSTPVPNIPATSTSITTTPIVKPAIVKPEQTDVNRIDTNSLPPEVLKKEIEPISEPLLEPKTEYLEDVNNEDSVEDLTLDDDDDMEGMDISNMSNISNMSRPGPSHGNDISNQGFAPWQLGANQSGTDEVFMAAQEAVNQHRDSQGTDSLSFEIVEELNNRPEDSGKTSIDLTENEVLKGKTELTVLSTYTGNLGSQVETLMGNFTQISSSDVGGIAIVKIISLSTEEPEDGSSYFQESLSITKVSPNEFITGNSELASLNVNTIPAPLEDKISVPENVEGNKEVAPLMRLEPMQRLQHEMKLENSDDQNKIQLDTPSNQGEVNFETSGDGDDIKMETSGDPSVAKTSKRRNQKAPVKLGNKKHVSTIAPGKPDVTPSGSGESSNKTSETGPSVDPSFLGHDNDYEFDDDEEKFRCKRCNKFFKTKGSLLGHQRYICGKTANHTCPFCRYRAKSAIAVRVHVGRKHNCWPRLNQDNKWIY